MFWQLDCRDSLTAWLPWQLRLNALKAWMLWQLECFDGLNALTAWMLWQLECFDSLNALTASAEISKMITDFKIQTGYRLTYSRCSTVEMLSHLKIAKFSWHICLHRTHSHSPSCIICIIRSGQFTINPNLGRVLNDCTGIFLISNTMQWCWEISLTTYRVSHNTVSTLFL